MHTDMEEVDKSMDEDVAAAIAELLPSDDAFDAEHFDSVAYINEQFPSEKSLNTLDPFLERLQGEIEHVESEILASVRKQSMSAYKAEKDLQRATTAISELFRRVKEIKSKAEKSETMVQELCQDIQALDVAKRNLTATITTLRRLHMMISAVAQLRHLTDTRQYKEAANILEAVNQLREYFADYSDSPKIREMNESIDATRIRLHQQVFQDFEAFCVDDGSSMPPNLSGAANVVQALGDQQKQELIKWFVAYHIEEYKRTFPPGDDISAFRNADKRYMWCRRKVRSFNEKLEHVFPESWCVRQEFCVDFCLETRKILTGILEQEGSSVGVSVLMKVLQRTIDFEKELTNIFAVSSEMDSSDELEIDPDADPRSPEGIRQKYLLRKRNEEMKKKEEEQAVQESRTQQSSYKYIGFISTCFQPYMKIYVESEDANLGEVVFQAFVHETWKPEGDLKIKVLTSSTDVYISIKRSLERCTAITKSETLLDLSRVFSTHLQSYSSGLLNQIPKPVTASRDGTSRFHALRELGSSSEHKEEIRLSDDGIEKLCYMINTAEYCFDTTEQLGDAICKKIEEQFIKAVDFQEVLDLFDKVINQAVKVLLLSVETQCELSFVTMTKVSWSSLSAVGDQSPFIIEIVQSLESFVAVIGRVLSARYFRFVVEKLLSSISFKFVNCIWKCKRLGEGLGAQQLLLDTQSLKSSFVRLPSLTPFGSMTNAFTKSVNRDMGKAESVVKVMLSPSDTIIPSYFALMPDFVSTQDFQRILDLKGLKRSEQQPLLERLESEMKRRSAK